MIKNYKQFNESIKDLLVGPTVDEISYNLKQKFLNKEISILIYWEKCNDYNIPFNVTEEEIINNFDNRPNDLLRFSLINKFDKCTEYALKNKADKRIYNNYIEMEKWFKDLITDMTYKKLNMTIIWEKNGKKLFKQDFNSNDLTVSTINVWGIFRDKYTHYDYGIDSNKIRYIIKDMVKKYLDWKGFNILYGTFW